MDTILYKFKSLHNIEHIFDILHNQRLFCTQYSNLNDPFEGIFLAILGIYPPLAHIYGSAMPKREIIEPKKIDDLYAQLEHVKVCSLSDNLKDVRLWAHYADGHKGIVIAIDFSNIKSNLYKVEYSPGLPQFWYTLLDSPTPLKVLSHKTNHWEFEAEYRIIQDKDYYPINDRIKTIYVGQRISDLHVELLKRITPESIPIYATKLNIKKVLIEQDKLLR